MELATSTPEGTWGTDEITQEPVQAVIVMSLGNAVRATQGGRTARNENKRQTYA
jgi:hypothetical protein